MSASKRHERYEEGRRFPRIPVAIPITIVHGQNQTTEAVTYDISPDGIQIRCNQAIAQILHPKCERIEESARPPVDVTLNLPAKKGEKKFIARCHIVYMIFLKEAESNAENAAIGLKYMALKGRSEKYLHQFLFKGRQGIGPR